MIGCRILLIHEFHERDVVPSRVKNLTATRQDFDLFVDKYRITLSQKMRLAMTNRVCVRTAEEKTKGLLKNYCGARLGAGPGPRRCAAVAILMYLEYIAVPARLAPRIRASLATFFNKPLGKKKIEASSRPRHFAESGNSSRRRPAFPLNCFLRR